MPGQYQSRLCRNPAYSQRPCRAHLPSPISPRRPPRLSSLACRSAVAIEPSASLIDVSVRSYGKAGLIKSNVIPDENFAVVTSGSPGSTTTMSTVHAQIAGSALTTTHSGPVPTRVNQF